MRLTPTILFLSILLTIESLVVAAPGLTNPFKSKKASAPAPQQETVTNYDVRAYSNMNCRDGYLGQFSGPVTAGGVYHHDFPNSNCALIYSVPAGCSLTIISLQGLEGSFHLKGPFSTGTHPMQDTSPFDTVELQC
ncbi:hypothetical protein F5877DRAFT_67394 [Lentinula edodes]|nr:hypothetical protein F5877DRAFT_67394 [Lentinula edodes]